MRGTRSARPACTLCGGRLGVDGLLADVEVHRPEAAEPGSVQALHAASVLEHALDVAARGGGRLRDGDTCVSPHSLQAALTAVQGARDAVDRVLDDTWQRAFVACRPPGHHAEADRSMGFCLFNNVALAAEHALLRPNVERVAIVDWDVHHGNGTQHLFEERADVFYVSLHQWPWYPGTGAATERGNGAGEGATLNLPLAAGSGDVEWLRAFDEQAAPALDRFAPDLVLVSAGFDAHERDPLSGTRLTAAAYASFTERLLSLAGGRLVSVLEGGYDLDSLAESAAAHVGALLD